VSLPFEGGSTPHSVSGGALGVVQLVLFIRQQSTFLTFFRPEQKRMVYSTCRNQFNGSSIRFQLSFLLGLALKNVDVATDVGDSTSKVEFSSASSLCPLTLRLILI